MMRIIPKMLSAAILSAVGCFTAKADFFLDGEYPWGKMGDKNVTAHRAIYKPLSGVKPKIFFVGYRFGLREIAEFRQRFDCDYQFWPTESVRSFSPFEPKQRKFYAPSMDEKTYREERGRIFGDLKNCDVMIFGKFPFELVPADLQKKILDRVRSGASLILILKDDKLPKIKNAAFKPSFPLANIPMNSIPGLKGAKLYSAKLGSGKIAALKYSEPAFRNYMVENLVPYDADDPLYYEYYYAFLGTLIRKMTAKDAPSMVLKGAGAVVSGKLPAGASIRADYLDRYGALLASKKVSAKPGMNEIGDPEYLPASTAMMDAFLTDNTGRVISYAARPVSGTVRNRIAEVKLDSDITKDRVYTGTVKMAGSPAGKLRFRAVDEKGRLIYDREVAASKGENKFKVEILPFDSYSAKLEIRYLEGGKLADRKIVPVYFPVDYKQMQNDFMSVVWTAAVSGSRTAKIALAVLKNAGVDVVMDTQIMFHPARSKAAPRNLSEAGIGYAIYLTRLNGFNKYQKLCNFSLADAVRKNGSFLDKNGKPFTHNYHTIEKIVSEASRFGVAFYNLGDENALTEVHEKENCFCPECAERFRVFLKGMYGTIGKLNAEYGTKYKDFSGIIPYPLDVAAEKELLPMWLDFRMFMDHSFIDWHKLVINQIRRHDKTSSVGIEGMTYPDRSRSGFNLAKMFPNFSFCAPYFTPRESHALKYLKPGSLKAAWYGTYEGEMGEQMIRQRPWKYLFAGLNGAFWWTAGAPGYSIATIYRMDLGLLNHFLQTREEIMGMKKSGIAKLLMDSHHTKNGIAVHYSQNCLHAANLNPDKTTWELSISNMGELIQSLGMEYEFLAPEEITAGKLKDFKVLFLPYSQAISKEEAAAMREFVRNGGLLIADYNPAIMDEHGKFLEKSQLADVFGPLDKLNVKRYGKGTTALLYDYIDGAALKAQRGTGAGIQRGLMTMLKKYAGVVPVAFAEDKQGYPAEFTVFEDNANQYLCFLGPITEEGAAKKSEAGAEAGATQIVISKSGGFREVFLPRPAHVYDLGTGKYLGKVRKFSFELTPAVGRVFALTQEKAPVPDVNIPSALAYGKTAEFRIKNVSNPCHVTIISPDGKTVFEQNVKANGTFRFIPSFELPAGAFKVSVKNVVGGLEKKFSINLK